MFIEIEKALIPGDEIKSFKTRVYLESIKDLDPSCKKKLTGIILSTDSKNWFSYMDLKILVIIEKLKITTKKFLSFQFIIIIFEIYI